MNFVHTDNTTQDIEPDWYHLKHPQPEVLDENDQPFVQDTYITKQKQLLAVVASLPLLAGLIASVVLTFQAQEIRRYAQDQVQTNAETFCVQDKAFIQIGVKTQLSGVMIHATESYTGDSVVLVPRNSDEYTYKVISTQESTLSSGTIQFSFRSHTGVIREFQQAYNGIECGEER